MKLSTCEGFKLLQEKTKAREKVGAYTDIPVQVRVERQPM